MSRAPSSPRAAPRTSIKDRISTRTMLLRRARKWLRPAAWTLFVLIILGGGGMLARTAAPGGGLATLRDRLADTAGAAGLRVTTIDIRERANTPEPLLRAAIGVSKGDPILGFSVEQARARIESLTWVEQATVERRLPGTIVVTLRERRPFAIWQYQKKHQLVDRVGAVVANQDVSAFKDKLPMVVGAGAPAGAAALMAVLDKFPSLTPRILASTRMGDRRWDINLKSGITIMLPEGHEKAALERLMLLQAEHALLDRPLAIIDLRLPDRLVVRPRPEPPAVTQGVPVPQAAKRPT